MPQDESRTVRVHVKPGQTVLQAMDEIRSWLDDEGILPIVFETSRENDRIVCHLEFETALQAAEFSERFP